MPSFEIADNKCQLCFQEIGTVLHRYECPASLPEGGWSTPPATAKLAAGASGPERIRMVEEHGMLVVRVASRPRTRQDTFQWHSCPPDESDPNLCWYIDGSAMNAEWCGLSAAVLGEVVGRR